MLLLQNLLIILGLTVIAVMFFRRISLPPVLGYLLVGAIVGPYGLQILPEGEQLDYVAEFGVVFLLFMIGLELSLPKLISMRRSLLGLGGLQVVLTCAATMAFAVLVGGLPLAAAFTIAGALALSSTAVATKLLIEQGELHQPHGRTVLSILLFQDLAAVPFLIIVPTLSGGTGESIGTQLFTASLKGILVFLIMLAAGRWLLRPLYHIVAARRSSELFMLTTFLVVLIASWITEELGLSLAFGAFLAGVMLAETEYYHQIETDILPFRDLFLGLFFITIGMKVSFSTVLANWNIILGIVCLLIVSKAVIITLVAKLAKMDIKTGLRTALILAQGGEFGFALLTLALENRILDSQTNQIIIASIVISIAIAPLLIRKNEEIADVLLRTKKSDGETLAPQSTQEAEDTVSQGLENHVIICGFGRVGQTLARFLEQDGIPYIGLDLDPTRLKEASQAREPVLFGDATKIDTLKAIQIDKAKLVIISYFDDMAAKKALRTIRSAGYTLPVLVRTRSDANLEKLLEAGATEVVPEILEASLMLATHMLLILGLTPRNIGDQIQELKTSRYKMLRGFYTGEDDTPAIESDEHVSLHAVTITDNAYAEGRTIEELANTGDVNITTFMREGIKTDDPAPETVLKEGDVIILEGSQDELQKGEETILRGS